MRQSPPKPTAPRRLMVMTTVVIVVACATAFYHLLSLRYQSGDIYPPYSTLATNPLGMSVVYEALGSLEGVSVERNLAPITKMTRRGEATLFIAGANTSKDPESVIEILETFADEGGRLVIAFGQNLSAPTREQMAATRDDLEGEGEDEGEGEGEDEEDKPSYGDRLISIEERWDFEYETSALTKNADAYNREVVATRVGGPDTLPDSFRWRSTLHFYRPSEDWREIYKRGAYPVVMERDWGRGSIVLMSDSFLLSNEAMRDERSSEFLSWVVGPNSVVIFDERHLGVGENPGIMTLARRYGMMGILGVSVGLFLLFVWHNAVSLVPKRDEPAQVLSFGRDSTSGLSDLLRRSVPPASLLRVCVEEWSHTFSGSRASEFVGQVKQEVTREEALPRKKRDLVQAYKRINKILRERKP